VPVVDREKIHTETTLILIKVFVLLSLSLPQALTDDQLRQLSTNQVNALTPAQYSVLNVSQQAVVNSKATVSFQTPTETGNGRKYTRSCLFVFIFSRIKKDIRDFQGKRLSGLWVQIFSVVH
jgi:hypothetical protein